MSAEARTLDVVGLVGNPKAASRTCAVTAELLEELVGPIPEAGSTVIDLAEHMQTLGPPLGDGAADHYASLRRNVSQARVLVVASPTFKGTYTGLLKSFLDGFDSGALSGVVAVPLMTMGVAAHYMAADMHLRPLLLELGACLPTSSLIVLESEFDRSRHIVTSWLETNGPVLSGALEDATSATLPPQCGASAEHFLD